ncbi:MAG: hypothetical protein LBI63_02210 [Candidatus Ancillula sp.]|nr:hypothetical protein [Candidatus Ancillula sp.]
MRIEIAKIGGNINDTVRWMNYLPTRVKHWDSVEFGKIIDVAREYAKLMGIQEHGGRWVAVKHGLSKNGNDHIHMVFNRY